MWSERPRGEKIIFDFVDSYLAVPRTPQHLLRGAAKFVTRQSRKLQLDHWAALRKMCRRADAVICSTLEQKESILPDNPNVHIVLDFRDELLLPPKRDYRAHEPFRLVWEGLPINATTLGELGPILRGIDAKTPLALDVVTSPRYYRWMGRFGERDTLADIKAAVGMDDITLHPWTAATVHRVATQADLAVIPIPMNEPLYRGKPENKLLIFWELAVPTLVTATPAYARAMTQAGIDMACASPQEWDEKLARFIHDENARASAGARGAAFVGSKHTPAQRVAAWDAVFQSVGA